MSRLTLVLRLAAQLTAAFALIITMAASAHAVPIMINNGLAPPNPANVLNDGTYAGDDVYVRNVGCPPGRSTVHLTNPCPSPGAATEVEVVNGGTVGQLRAYDSSNVMMSGGTVGGDLYARVSTTIAMSGGTVDGRVYTDGSSTVTISGGTVGGGLFPQDSSIIRLIGSDFMVNGVPVPYGDLSALTGTLTGTLALGDSLDTVFYQGGYADEYTGTIRLVPEAGSGLLLALGLAGLAAARRHGVAE